MLHDRKSVILGAMTDRKVLTLKYRPQTFDELLVQEHVKRTLKKAIEHNRFANAYLFAGPRGVGKTTTARILSKCLDCLNTDKPTVTPCNKCSACVEISQSRSMDVLEIDGASNRGIDQVRELRENIKYAPSSLRYKVYIIDEVHMLTEPAFNALLKTLEEPPPHAKFIFATTSANKVLPTIISRCQRFDFRKATPDEIVGRLRWLAKQESIAVSDEALLAIGRRADGSIRDGESILEQLATYRPEQIELPDVEELLGLVPGEVFFSYVDLLLQGDTAGLLRFVNNIFEKGHDLFEFYTGLVEHFRNILLIQAGGPAENLGLLPAEITRLEEQAKQFSRAGLIKALEILLRAEEQAKYTRMPRVVLEYLALELTTLVCPEPQTAPGPAPADPPPVRPTTRSKQPSLDSVWQELRLKTSARKPVLTKSLDLAHPESYEKDTVTVSLTREHQPVLEKLKAEQNLLEELLSEVTGRPTTIQLHLSRKAAGKDPQAERITGILGEVEEER